MTKSRDYLYKRRGHYFFWLDLVGFVTIEDRGDLVLLVDLGHTFDQAALVSLYLLGAYHLAK